MGEANRRGTFEQRKAEAIAADREKVYRQPEPPRQLERLRLKPGASGAALAATIMAICGRAVPVADEEPSRGW